MDNSTKIFNQFNRYISILSKVSDEKNVSLLTDKFGERLVLSPRGLTDEDGGSPGSLIEFSLSVAQVAKEIGDKYGNTKSLVKISLLHELGRLGDFDEGKELYIPQDSDWHRDKLGQNYKYNDSCSKMNISHRTLWLVNNLGFSLTQDEYMAILTSQGFHLTENQFYGKSASKNKTISCFQSARNIVLSGA
jgi:hypothetical protein